MPPPPPAHARTHTVQVVRPVPVCLQQINLHVIVQVNRFLVRVVGTCSRRPFCARPPGLNTNMLKPFHVYFSKSIRIWRKYAIRLPKVFNDFKKTCCLKWLGR